MGRLCSFMFKFLVHLVIEDDTHHLQTEDKLLHCDCSRFMQTEHLLQSSLVSLLSFCIYCCLLDMLALTGLAHLNDWLGLCALLQLVYHLLLAETSLGGFAGMRLFYTLIHIYKQYKQYYERSSKYYDIPSLDALPYGQIDIASRVIFNDKHKLPSSFFFIFCILLSLNNFLSMLDERYQLATSLNLFIRHSTKEH